MQITLTLDDQQAHVLRHALVIAAERFEEHKATFSSTHPRVAFQFHAQAKDTRALIDHLDDTLEDQS